MLYKNSDMRSWPLLLLICSSLTAGSHSQEYSRKHLVGCPQHGTTSHFQAKQSVEFLGTDPPRFFHDEGEKSRGIKNY